MTNPPPVCTTAATFEEMTMDTNTTKTDLLDNISQAMAKAKAVAYLIGNAPAETLRTHLEWATALHADLLEQVDRNVQLLANCKE